MISCNRFILLMYITAFSINAGALAAMNKELENVSDIVTGNEYCEWFVWPRPEARSIFIHMKWFFVCIYHENMGEKLDQLITNETSATSQSHLSLIIVDSIFPNLTIDKNWYGKGVRYFTLLELRHCEFDFIVEGAFDQPSFRMLDTLLFKDSVRPLSCKTGMLKGLSLVKLELNNITVSSMDYDFLWPVMNHLIDLTTSESLMDELTLAHYIGGIALPTLETLHITDTAVNVLRYRSLFGLQNVTTIFFKNCGLVSIEERTFDHISKTLSKLNLEGNRLVTLPNSIFDALLQSNTVASLLMDQNPWVCDCDLSIFLNKIQSIESYHISVYSSWPQNCGHFISDTANECSGIANASIVVYSTSCMNQYGTNFLSIDHPVYRVIECAEPDIDLLFKTKNMAVYRVYLLDLAIERHGSSFDLDRKYNHDLVKCIMHNRTELKWSVTRKNMIHIICVMDNPKWTVVWPLNCHSFRFQFEGEPNKVWLQFDDIRIMAPIVGSAYFIGILLGMLGSYLVMANFPQLLKGHERVVITKNRGRSKLARARYTVFVMPDDWVNPRKNISS